MRQEEIYVREGKVCIGYRGKSIYKTGETLRMTGKSNM